MSIVLTVVGTICALMACIYGASVAQSAFSMAPSAENFIAFAFGLATFAYGLASLVLIALSWVKPNRSYEKLSKGLGIAMPLMFVAGSMDSMRLSGLELWSIFAASCFAVAIFWAVRSALNVRLPPNHSLQARPP